MFQPQWEKYIYIKKKICHRARSYKGISSLSEIVRRVFPGSPVVKTLCFQCKGHGFDPWWRG